MIPIESPFSLKSTLPLSTQEEGVVDLSTFVNPFSGDIHDPDLPSKESPHHAALLQAILQVAGKGHQSVSAQAPTLLLAPRAGFGKTWLLDKLRHALGDQTPLISLEFSSESSIATPEVLRQLFFYSTEHPKEATSWLEESIRILFGRLTAHLVAQGRIPCADKKQALHQLEHSATTVFSPKQTDQVIGTWFRKNFTQLLPVYAREWLPEARVPDKTAHSWLHWCFQLDNERDLPWEIRREIFHEAIGGLDQRIAMGLLSRMLARARPFVFTIDHLDRYFQNPAAGMKLSTLILDLPGLCGGSPVVAAMNDDLWRSSFSHNLPSAFEDRLTAHVLHLSGMTLEEGQALLFGRLAALEENAPHREEFLQLLDLASLFSSHPDRSISPRYLLRYAAEKWEVFSREASPSEDFDLASPLPGLIDEESLSPPIADDYPSFVSVPDAPISPVASPFTLQASPAAATSPFRFLGDPAPEAEPVAHSTTSPAALIETDTRALPRAPERQPEQEDHFLRLKEMLSKLQPAASPDPNTARETPEANREQPVTFAPAPTTPVTFNPLASRPDYTIPGDEIQAKVVRNSVVSRAAIAEPKQEITAEGSAPDSPVLPSDESMEIDVEIDPSASLRDRYLAVRDALAGANVELSVDLIGMMELVRLAGKRFPVVVFDEWELPSMPGYRVLRWTYEQNEILIGSEPVSNDRYWTNLADYAERRQNLIQTTEENPPGFLKLVVLADEDVALEKEALLVKWKIEHNRQLIDWLFFDRWSIGSLQAAEQVIRRAVDQPAAGRPGEVIRLLSSELAFFWKKLTRPPQKSESAPSSAILLPEKAPEAEGENRPGITRDPVTEGKTAA